jgi:hypothetical protein
LLRNILTVAGITWFYSVLLGLFFAGCLSGSLSMRSIVENLRLPGVVPIAVLGSTFVAVFLTPLVIWAFRRNLNLKDLMSYGGGLFFLLLIYIAIVVPTTNNRILILYGPVLLAIIGILVIGFIHRRGLFK